MTLRNFRISAPLLPALLLLATAPFVSTISAQTRPTSAAPESPYGGTTVEGILARVNDQIITRSDYDRALKEMDDEARQRGASMQQISEGHKDLLRNLIDQQLWISKGKELNINGETELVKQLDEIRKKYNLETLEDLEKAAKDQGVSFEDFKANIRNGIITQQVMREEVGRKVSVTPGEVQRYFEAHKQDYAQPESVRLSEILISTGAAAPAGEALGAEPENPEKVAAAKAKADDIEAKLKAGGNFEQLARTLSDGPTAAEGGELGKFLRGGLAKVFEDKTFAMKPGEVTEPIRTKQGYVIFKVVEHVPGGIPQYKDVQQQVEEAFYMSRMEPAMRAYLTTMREEAYIDIKPGYVDTGASPKQTKPIYSAYTPPSPKKKKKVQRTRFRETEHGFRNKSAATAPALVPVSADTTPATATTPAAKQAKSKTAAPTSMKAGKKEKIRYGQAPRETLPDASATKVEDAGALPKVAENTATTDDQPAQPAAPPAKKTRYTARLKEPKAAKQKGPTLDTFAPAPPATDEVADRQVQTAPLGLAGDTTKKKKKKATASTGEKTRMQERPKAPSDKAPLEMTPAAPAKGAPAPATAPKVNPTPETAPVPSSAPQQTPTSPDPPQSTTPASEPPH
jgi:peptidyl-prolyl cis-trans isomerase SurA